MSYRLHPPLKGAVTSIFHTHLPTIVMSPFHRPPSSSLWRSAATIDLELRSHVRDRPWSHGGDKLWSMTASDSDLEALPWTSKDDGELSDLEQRSHGRVLQLRPQRLQRRFNARLWSPWTRSR